MQLQINADELSQSLQFNTESEHALLSERADLFVACQGISPLQLNAEGHTKSQINVIEHLAEVNNVVVVLLQETYWCEDNSPLKISGYTMASHTSSKIHSTATFVKNTASWKPIASCSADAKVELTTIEVESITVVNVNYHFKSDLTSKILPDITNHVSLLANFISITRPEVIAALTQVVICWKTGLLQPM